MKTTLSLLLLFVGSSSFADQVRIDPAYLNDGVYSQETDENAIIQVFTSGGEPCTSRTPVGGACLCNGFVLSRTERPYHVRVHPFLFIKANWHLTNLKGRHAGGNICTKDREATPEERASFVADFHHRGR
jgi:hypothetical protein